ncbi:hypothetical protein PEBR_22805 [Penicillium brasilianum]|uniref:Uncharacterized protein n=1 Tax=Penicillium brasilianum TaxID=104259 RepID=A0A1S9RL82_PENBI|nr:hypothetical protein PEBR_22805 [Penicillium brasilianum]
MSPELLETILKYLDLDSIKALRLTNREFAEKCLGPRFLSFIQQPIVDVSTQNLRSLHALACNSALGKMIHSLTFLATSLDSSVAEKNVISGTHTVRRNHGPMFEATVTKFSSEEFATAKSNLNWLKEQQKARANERISEMIELLQLALKEFRVLHSIQLDSAFVIGPTERGSASQGKWHPLWMRASQVFFIVVTAMAQSGVSVKKFDAYRHTPRCCIPSGDITVYISALDPKQLDTVSKDLESLELSMSAEVPNGVDSAKARRKYEEAGEEYLSINDPRAVLADGIPGIASLLKSAHALRELDLSFRNTLKDGILDSYDRIIDMIAQETQFPMLEKCAFSGLPAKGESILLFLQKHPNLNSFTLHECTLTAGSWPPIFSQLDQSMPNLESVSFSNLYGECVQEGEQEEGEDRKKHYEMVNLQPTWDIEQPLRWNSFEKGPGRQVHTRTFDREELKKGLVFPPLIKRRGRAKGSAELLRWINTRRALYAPP